MNINQINENFSISEQITLEDIKTLASHGVKTLICNRPDGEEPNQLACAEIKMAADANGMTFVHIPVAGREIPNDVLQKFVAVVQNSNDKIHAYCRTGMRSSIFWELSQQK